MRAAIALVVPVWNQAALLQQLLESVARQTRPPDEVVVVDSGSTDGAADLARTWGARVIALGVNRGFAAAVNAGIAACTGEWVALVNSDVELEADWLNRLLEAAVSTDAWFCCGKLLMYRDKSRLDGTWDLIAASGFPLRAGNGERDAAIFQMRRRITLAPATATLYRRELFAQVGGFDEGYESYLEDVDFSLRCAARDLHGTYEPAAVASHVGAGSTSAWSGHMVRLYARNQKLLVRKLFPCDLQRKFRRRIRMGRLLWGALALRHRAFVPWLRGMREGTAAQIRHAPLDAARLERILMDSEAEIKELCGASTYWRLYFLFTRGGSR